MTNIAKVVLSSFIVIAFIVVFAVTVYQYNQKTDELTINNQTLAEENEALKEEMNELENELEKNIESDSNEATAEEIKTQREILHENIDKTIEQFLTARYVINDETKDKRYERAEEVSTENAMERYFEEALQSVTPETEISEYSDIDDYKSYIALEDVNTSRTYALASATQVTSQEESGSENITNFLFEFELILENGDWKVDEVNVKDISLYSN